MSFSVGTPAHSELLIRKSRFIGCIQAVPDRAAAQAVVTALRLEHPDAVHVCWALLAGGQSAAVDDGEPNGTAGRPMLEVLRHHDLDGVLATVVRYFGGIKLGAGGLVRAYTDCVAQAMLVAHKVPLQHWTPMRCSVPYALEGLMRHLLNHADTQLGPVSHTSTVDFSFAVPATAANDLISHLNEATHGKIIWRDDA